MLAVSRKLCNLFMNYYRLTLTSSFLFGTRCQTRMCKRDIIFVLFFRFCYTFAYINVHFGSRNRYRMLVYYTVTLLENTVIAVCWFNFRRGGGSLLSAIRGIDEEDANVPSETAALSDNVALILVVVVVAIFVLGMIFFLLYYLLLHPQAPGTNLCLRGEKDESLEDDKSLAPPAHMSCGDNYRVHRDAKQFRSWHSASLNYNPEINASVKKKRPSSEVLSSNLYDGPYPKNTALELKSGDCSCYFVKNDVDAFHNFSAIDSSNSESVRTATKKPKGPATKYLKTTLYSPEVQDDYVDAAERKRRQVSE